jgi:acetyl-CoA acyltransferase
VVLRTDETIRRDTSRDRLASLKASFRPEGGRVTAGNASQISDGAAAVILMAADSAKRLNLRTRARIRAVATVGSDPVLMLTGPIAATRKVLERAGLTLNDIDLFEVNEAFAPVPMIWMKEFGVDHDRVNVNGGAMALGHPIGATGAILIGTVLDELERTDGQFGLMTMCAGGGMAPAIIIERV